MQQPLAFRLWLSLACLSASREGGPYMAAGLFSFGICSILCSVSVPGVPIEPFMRKVFFVCLSGDPTVWVLSHISSLRLSSGHSGPVLTLRTSYAGCAFLPSPNSLVVDPSVWATSPLAVVLRYVFCGVFFFFLLVILPSEIPELPSGTPVRGFPTVWRLLLFPDSLPRMGLRP